MTIVETIFIQEDSQENALQNIVDMAILIEDQGMDTFSFVERHTIHLAVKREDKEAAFDIVYRKWHLDEDKKAAR